MPRRHLTNFNIINCSIDCVTGTCVQLYYDYCIYMYINQKIKVKWNDRLSNQYSSSNGVNQGGCLSPTLFSIYLNDVIDVLPSSNIGCKYGNHYMGVYCSADEIGLLSPTLSGLKEVLTLIPGQLLTG